MFRSVGAVEWEPPAAASYAMNFGAESPRPQYFDPPEIFCTDIVGWMPKWKKREVDVVVGGPPCQGFSALNRGKVRAERNELWQEFIRVVVQLQPQVFVIENVDRFVRSVEFGDLKARIGSGDLMNYRLVPPPGSSQDESEVGQARRYLLNAADYGALQARRRAIVIGVRTDGDRCPDQMRYPAPTHSREALVRRAGHGSLDLAVDLKPWLTVDELFRATANWRPEGTELPPLAKEVSAGGVPGTFAGPYRTTELHITRNPEAVSLARYNAIPRGGNRKDLRGRFVCRFDNGESVITQKVGWRRDDDPRLRTLGTHRVVVNGAVTTRELSVRAVDVPLGSLGGGASRSKAQSFGANVWDGHRERRAVVEYLSTDAWDAHDAGAGDVMGRVRTGQPSVTIRTEFYKPEKGRYLHPSDDRPITHYEAAKLQGFPDDFRWCGTKSDIAKQIGNAVPVPLARKIAESIYTYLRVASS